MFDIVIATTIIIMLAVSTAASVLLIGKRHEPTTPGFAVTVMVINFLLAVGVFLLVD